MISLYVIGALFLTLFITAVVYLEFKDLKSKITFYKGLNDTERLFYRKTVGDLKNYIDDLESLLGIE